MSQRKQDVIAEIKKTFTELSGQELGDVDAAIGFLDLGFDSMFLTQAAAALKNRFGVKVTFRQLNDGLSTFESLAEFLESRLPSLVEQPSKEKPASPAKAPQSSQTETPAAPRAEQGIPAFFPGQNESSPTSTVLERVVKEQLRVMEAQLALLRRSAPPKFTESAPAMQPQIAAPMAASHPPEKDVSTPPAGAPGPATQHGPFRQIDRAEKGGLTPPQRAHLDWFTPRYLAKTPKSKAYTQLNRRHFADPRAVAGFKSNWKEMVYPIVSTRSAGAYLWDLDGNRWVDVTMGFGVALLGHSPPFITEAVKKQLDLGVEIGPQSPLAGEVAELICEFTGMDRVTFCNTGSEAVMAALRVCRTVTGRTKIALFAGAYHGTFDEVLVKGAWMGGEPKTFPIAPGVAPNLISEVVVLEYGTPQSLEWIRQHSHELAAVLVESVQSRHPDLQPVEFLREVRIITQTTETPLIFDEVITGFRCHPGGAQSLFGIQADLATYGKIIGGGMPFGFVAGKAWLMDAFDGGFWQFGDDSVPPSGVTFFAGTFVRHPLAMAAAKAMLVHLKEQGPQLQAGLAGRTDHLTGSLNRYFEQNQVPLHLEHFTSVWYPHFGAEVKFASLLYYHLREKGLHIWEGRPCFLSTAHTIEDEAFIERAFKLSVAEMQSGGLLPGASDEEFSEEVKRLKGGISPAATASAQTKSEFPLTEAQKEVWVASQISREASCSFNETCSIHLKGSFDPAVMRRAIQELVRRHEALRGIFNAEGDVQRFADELALDVPLFDFSPLPAGEREARLQALLAEEGLRLFDLAKGPLVAMQLFKLAEQEHVLVFTAHHIACDGWSYDVVLSELSQLYSAYQAGQPHSLGAAMPFHEYADREQALRDSEEGREAEKYWLQVYVNPPGILELPADRPRPPVQSFEGARLSRPVRPELWPAVKKAAAQHRVTPFIWLLATYETLLHRLSGQNDLVVGIFAAGQNLIGADSLVGHCANLLPLRQQVDGERPFAELLQATKTRVLDAYEHQSLTFGSLLQKLKLPRDPSRAPLTSVLFNLDPPLSKLHFDGLEYAITLNPRRCYQFDLGFNAVEANGALNMECDYNSDLFEPDTILRWLETFETLLEGSLDSTQSKLNELPVLTNAERRRALIEWNATEREYPRGKTVHALVSEQAARTPDALAAEFDGQKLTYAELEKRSNQLANHLRETGVGPDTLVGICVERSLDMIIGMLGILKAGGAYVPIDPEFPPDRIAFMLEDAAAPVLITQETLRSRLPTTTAQVLCLDSDWPAIAGESPVCAPSGMNSENLAYVIYTSGSTGKPKGVEISHRAVVNFLESVRREPGLSPADTMLALTTISFDIAGLEIFLPLIAGAKMVIVGRETALDPAKLSDVVARRGITVIQATPATWRMLLNAGWTGNRKLKVLCGGEAMPRDLAGRLLACCGEVWNMYGPTETTIWSTTRRLQTGESVTIGRPIANTQAYIVDKQLRPVAVGVPGELLIGGDGLARGYRNQPGLTTEKFIPNPFRWQEGARVYRTGDQARFCPNGEIEFLGRMDSQVKIRGYRVETGEIEAVLQSHPAVRETVVVARDDASGEKRLIAYYAPRSGEESGASEWSEIWEGIFENALRDGAGRSDLLEKVDSIAFGWTAGGLDRAEIDKQVGEWIDATVRRIETLRPNKVLELGCGTGQILLRLASRCDEFWGTDIAATAIQALEQRVKKPGHELRQVKLLRQPADNFEGIPEKHFDTVVLNSVSQYFPDVNYLLRVLKQAVRATRPGGRVFVGDVQSLALMECYHNSNQLERLPAETTVQTLREVVHKRIAGEVELMIDPSFFHAFCKTFPRLSHVELQLRRGRAVNETTQFHFDAIIHVEGDGRPVPVEDWRNWQAENLSLAGLKQWLKESKSKVVGVRGAPNARLKKEVAAWELLQRADDTLNIGEIRRQSKHDAPGVDPEDVWSLAEELGFRVEVRWSGSGLNGLLDIAFWHPKHHAASGIIWPEDEIAAQPWPEYVNSPKHRATAPDLRPELRKLAKSRLPDYMVPALFVAVDELPQTPNGKIDARALPIPEPTQPNDAATYAVPRNATEEKLAGIWAEVLGVPQVGITDNFFELGGHSLFAVALFTKIERAFGKRLPLATLFRAPTIEQLAGALSSGAEHEPRWTSLVAIQPQGNGPRFFCVHGAGGNVLLYRELARSVGKEHPFYGLQARGLDGQSAFLTSIEDMAAHYLEELRRLKPEGPYCLGGYCMGGTVAYEMAQRLVADGQQVALLALFDTYNFSRALQTSSANMIRQKLKFHLRNLTLLRPGDALKYVAEKIRLAREGELANLLGARNHRSRAAADGQHNSTIEASIQTVNDSAALTYQPQPYSGRLTIFKTQTNYDFYPDPNWGWGDLAIGGLDLVQLPVNPHAMLVRPYVEILGIELKKRLDQIGGGNSNPNPQPGAMDAELLAI